MGSIALSDHPLMGREDRLAAALRELHSSYARHMTTDLPAQCDDRLAALLGAAASASASGYPERLREAVEYRGAAVSPLQYDFERDSVPELCARASAVLSAISQVRVVPQSVVAG